MLGPLLGLETRGLESFSEFVGIWRVESAGGRYHCSSDLDARRAFGLPSGQGALPPSREGWVLSRLIIVDQSLKGLGGHHFDYVLQVSQAASRQGAEVVVVAHQQFTNHSSLQHYARIIPHFRRTTYSRYSLLAGLRAMHRRPSLVGAPPNLRKVLPDRDDVSWGLPTSGQERATTEASRSPQPTPLSKVWQSLSTHGNRWWRSIQTLTTRIQDAHGRNRVLQSFAKDCVRVFPNLVLMPTDHVFFTTINDLELAGLFVYWMGAPESYLPHWHLQFHFDAFEGRVPEYRRQYRVLDPLRCLFEDIDHAVPTHQIHYYATTAAIADQYQRLATRPITELAYPISEAFRSVKPVTPRVVGTIATNDFVDAARATDAASRMVGRMETNAATSVQTAMGQSTHSQLTNSAEDFPNAPLWSPSATGIPIVVAGGIRSEKGQKGLPEIWPELKRQVLDPGLGFIVCQRQEKRKWYRQRFSLTNPSDQEIGDASVQYLPHPLSTPQYQDLIRHAGIGLLTYDPRSYANRRAGIFGEYLASGVPTLVPAGTWMADQLALYQVAHQQQTLKQNHALARWSHSDFDWTPWNVPTACGSVTFDGGEVPAYAWSPSIPAAKSSAHDRLLSLRLHWVWPKETGTFCRIEILFYDQHRQVIATDSATVGQLGQNTAQSALFRVPANAIHFRLGLKNAFYDRNATIQRLLVDVVSSDRPLPLGAVGLTYDSLSQIPARLSELCTHHSHYKETTSRVADAWFKQHDPAATVMQLINVAAKAQRQRVG